MSDYWNADPLPAWRMYMRLRREGFEMMHARVAVSYLQRHELKPPPAS